MSDTSVLVISGGLLGLFGLFAAVAAVNSSAPSAKPVTASASQPPARPSSNRAQPHATQATREGSPAPARATVSMDEARRMSWAIVSMFESGSPEGRYGAFVVLRDGAGISYGRKQGTDESGTLDTILREYIDAGGRYAGQLRPYLPRLTRDETTLLQPEPSTWPAWMHPLKRLLVAAGDDPVMQAVQDRVFDRIYWRPAVLAWQQMGLRSPLALAVVFDTCIHSGSPRALAWVRRRFTAKPPSDGGDEREWVRQYVLARRRWLATHQKTALHATVYRMDAFTKLIQEGNWSLQAPITIPNFRTVIR